MIDLERITEIRAVERPHATIETLFPNGMPVGVDEEKAAEFADHYTTVEACPGCGDGWATWAIQHGVTHCGRSDCGWPGRAYFYVVCSEDTPGARHYEDHRRCGQCDECNEGLTCRDFPGSWQIRADNVRNLWCHPDRVEVREEREAREAAVEPA